MKITLQRALCVLGDMFTRYEETSNEADRAEACKAFNLINRIAETKFLIWSEEHRGWWKAGRCGYTENRGQAGRYSFDEALEIVKGANINLRDIPNEAMVALTDEEVA